MRYTKGNPGSRNLMTGPGPYYHHALWRHKREPVFRFDEHGNPVESWIGEKGIVIRPSFTVDDLIDYFYSRIGVRSPMLRRARQAADRGSVNALLENASLDQVLFAIDVLAEEHDQSKRVPPIIAASDYMEEAWDRLQIAQAHLKEMLAPLYQKRDEERKGSFVGPGGSN